MSATIDLKDYLDPVSIEKPESGHISGHSGFSHYISVHTENTPFGDLGKYRIALMGVPEGRNSPGAGSSRAPDSIRIQLYNLARLPGRLKIIDLGNMKKGITFNDTVAGLTDVLIYLLGENIFPIIIGGSSALALSVDRALASLKIRYTLASIDPRIDFISEKKEPDSCSYLNAILSNNKSTFNHFIGIGYQTFLNDQQVVNRFLRRKSELVRIGDVRKAIYLMEPLLRDADAAFFDISAVRQADAPGTATPSPNGFYGEEICLLSRYAGISDNLKVFGLFEVNPDHDVRNQTAGLAAQIIWFFLEGFSQKQYETPAIESSNSGRFIRYHVRITDLENELIFIKSNLTDRWWMELTSGDGRRFHIACSHDDYLKANHNEVPERWVRGFERLKS